MPERRSVAAAFVAAFLVVSLAVPVIGLFRDRPASFSWHMYSVSASLPDVWVKPPSGPEVQLYLDEWLGSRRAEVNYVSALIERACMEGEYGQPEYVRIVEADGTEVRSWCVI